MSRFKPEYVLLLCMTSFLVACSSISGRYPDSQALYNAAISDAAVASPGKIYPLKPIPSGEMVAVVSWVSQKKMPCTPQALPCDVTIGNNPLWVTLIGEVQSICRAWNLRGDALRRRLEQLLGMPPDPPLPYRMVAFAEYHVPRASLERPCLGIDETNPTQPVCTLAAQAATPAKLTAFVGQQMASSYVVDNPKGPGYPYTRLGYTYDWAPIADARHYGASEFIVMPMSAVKAMKVMATDDYCSIP